MGSNLMVIDGSGLISTLMYGSLSDFQKQLHSLDAEMIDKIASQCFRYGNGHCTENVGQAIGKVFDLCRRFKCDHAAVVFDKSSSTTYRKEMYPEYKAHRVHPSIIKDEVLVTKCVLSKIGIPVFWHDYFEADDLAGAIIETFKGDFDTVYYWSKDRDWFQLLDSNVKGLIQFNTEQEAEALRDYYSSEPVNNVFDMDTPSASKKILCVNEKIAHDLMGVYPSQVADYKGLAGDASDNIPGAAGIGVKTAKALLEIFGDLEGIYDAVENLSEDQFKARVKYLIKKCPYKALIDGKSQAYMSKDLATIRKNIDVPFKKEALRVSINKMNLRIAIDIYNLENELDYYTK